MKHKNFEFENEFRKLYSNINKDCKINEVQLFDTNIRIYVFCIREEIYISLKNILDIIEYFIDSKLDEECFEHAKSLLQTYKLVELDLDVENKDLDVCKASDITNQVFDKITERQKYASQETEDLLFNRIDMSSSTNDTQSLSDKPLNTMYPFIPSWNDSAMNDILQNIYSSNDYKDSSTAVEDTVGKKYMGRGRCRVKQANLKERPFVCEYPDCKRAFKRYEHLKRHNKMHTGERPYKCGYPGCMKAFSRSDNLSQHFKIHNVPHKGHTLNFRSYQYINKD